WCAARWTIASTPPVAVRGISGSRRSPPTVRTACAAPTWPANARPNTASAAVTEILMAMLPRLIACSLVADVHQRLAGDEAAQVFAQDLPAPPGRFARGARRGPGDAGGGE